MSHQSKTLQAIIPDWNNIQISPLATTSYSQKKEVRMIPTEMPNLQEFVDSIPDEKLTKFVKDFLSAKSGDMDTGSTTLIMGSSKSGKTYLMSEIINEMFKNKDYKNKIIPIVVTPNFYAQSYDKIRDFEKNGKIMVIENSEVLEKLIKTLYTINHHTNNKYKFVIFIDDVVSSKIQRQGDIEDLFLTHRNANISTVMCVQTHTISAKKSRYNANWTFFKRFNTDDEIETMIKTYLKGYFPEMPRGHKKSLIEVYKALVEDYRSIVLNNLIGKISIL